MKIKIAVALGVLFALAPLAAPKGRTQGLTFSASCDTTDTCTVTGSGLAASTGYILDLVDSCGASAYRSDVNTNSSGVLNIVLSGVYESSGCNVTGWTFTLATLGKRAAVVATYFASDGD